MEIRTFGVGGRLRRCEAVLKERFSHRSDIRLLLLTIPTTKDNQHINGTITPLNDVISLADEKTVISGYNLPKEFVALAKNKGALVYDASYDEDFLMKNAVLTANGALGHILTENTKDISDLKIGIIGFGRIGEKMTNLCLWLGANVTVYTTRENLARELCENTVSATVPTEITDYSHLDIIINTAPAKIIPPQTVEKLPPETKIIDLASGSIFPASDKLRKLSSVPDAMYPDSSGKIYADHIEKFIKEATE